MQQNSPPVDMSIVIVNYNVKSYLANLLDSLKKARQHLNLQIIVVDNASFDGSQAYIKQNYPEVQLLENKRNIGFGKANNRALQQCKGTYTLLINPDTLVEEHTLTTMKSYMDQHPDTGMATCTLLNGDGTFSQDCIRNIPTPFSALLRVFGLEKLAQRYSWLPNYYVTSRKPEQPIEVPIISGSFMFCRSDVLKELGGFDERFFMYFEDTDLCLRMKEAGYALSFIPYTNVVHYRGKSTRKDDIEHHLIFNRSLYKFYQKHYQAGYTVFAKLLLAGGIGFRAIFMYLNSLTRLFYRPAIDLLLLNILIVAAFVLRYDLPLLNPQQHYQQEYFAINILATVLFIAISSYYELYSRHKYSTVALLKTNTWTFLGIALITFFLRDFAFSRLILVSGLFAGFLSMAGVRHVITWYKTGSEHKKTAPEGIRILLAGQRTHVSAVIKEIRSRVDWNYELQGLVLKEADGTEQIDNIPVVGTIDNLPKIVSVNPVDEVFFTAGGLPYQQVLALLSRLTQQQITTRIIPESKEVILGQSQVEYLGSVPVMNMNWAYEKTWNKMVKRTFDIVLSALVITLTAPWYLYYEIKQDGKTNFRFYKDEETWFQIELFRDQVFHPRANILLLMRYIFKGDLSFVGAPLKTGSIPDTLYYKYGLTGYRQINEHRFSREQEKLRTELYYLQNYTIWMDLDILYKTIVHKREKLGKIEAC